MPTKALEAFLSALADLPTGYSQGDFAGERWGVPPLPRRAKDRWQEWQN